LRSLAEQNYYELIEAPLDGTPQQIERAYRIARSTYLPNSGATYSLFSAEDCAAILRSIDEAYAVLSDTRLRREYDGRLGRSEPASLPSAAEAHAEPAKLLEPVRERKAEAIGARQPARSEFDVENGLGPENGVFDGEVLRRIRVSLGIELEEISAITKINDQQLRSIEANHYDALPAPVYLRGFLKQIARCLSLDPARVADSYSNRMRESASRRV
jgi:flagellar biosynthesis protein FlhG